MGFRQLDKTINPSDERRTASPEKGGDRMRLTINGKSEEIDQVADLQQLVRLKNLPEAQVVLELNGVLIPRADWGQTAIQADATIEILRFVGGG
jgi:thiamine biosynthesis protein ThiS